MEIVKSLGLGGVHFLSAFDDDIDNELGCGKSPVLRTVNEMLRGFGECVLPSCPWWESEWLGSIFIIGLECMMWDLAKISFMYENRVKHFNLVCTTYRKVYIIIFAF